MTLPLDANTEEFLHHYHAGRNAYILRDFTQAIATFESAQGIIPTYQAVNIHLKRTYKYQ